MITNPHDKTMLSMATADSDSGAETIPAAGVAELATPRPTPKDDLYRFVSGPFLSSHEIPSDRPMDGTFFQLRDQAEADCREIVEDAPKDSLIGALFSSFMDVDGDQGVEQAGFQPLAADLAEIAVDDFESFARGLGRLDIHGVAGLAGFFVAKDSASDNDAAYVNQSGLSLPDEAYYREDAHRQIVEAFQQHVERMVDLARAEVANFVPSEFESKSSAELARAIVEFETKLAAGHWNVEQTRDAVKTYNPTAPADMSTGFPWKVWLDTVGLDVPMVVIGQPSYFDHVSELAGSEGLATFRLWAAWRILSQRAALLHSAASDENFDFYGRTLAGSTEQRARWKRGLSFVDGHISDEVGREFTARHFPPEYKERMEKLVDYLLRAYRERIEKLSWMTPPTRERALAKLETFRTKIGFPDQWKVFSDLSFEPHGESLVANSRAGSAWNHWHEVSKVGKPTDRSEWVMPAQMVNACYNPVVNDITFPAAILRPPFFNPDADMAQNFGAIGAVIGHEIGHGFDDQGSLYDGAGNLNSWWSDEDRTAFEGLTSQLVDQFDGLIPLGLKQRGLDSQAVNGRFTLGENIGDLGGLGIAVIAYRMFVEDQGLTVDSVEPAPFLLADGTALAPQCAESEDSTSVEINAGGEFTAMQRLFLSWSYVWRAAARPQAAAMALAIDPHSPAEFRCNVIARNVDEFAEAFGVEPGDGMWLDPSERVKIW